MKKWSIFSIFIALTIMLTGCSAAVEDAVIKAAEDTVKDVATDAIAKATSKSGAGSEVSSTSYEGKVEWAFTKEDQHPEKLLVRVMDQATSTMDIAIYSLTHPDIVKGILDAKKRGVTVRIISDEQQAGGKTQQQALKMLHNAGIPIKIDNHSGLMHLKMTIVDRKIATNGSFNYSKAASTTNDEVIMVLHDKKIAQSFSDEFERMWKDGKHYQDYQ